MRARPSPHLAIAVVLALLALFVAVPVAPAAAAIPTETDTSATTIHVDLANNRVDGYGWAVGSTAVVEVWQDLQAVGPLASATVDVADDGAGNGIFSHHFGQPWEGGFDIVSGMVVSVTDGTTTKVMSDTNLRIDMWDPTADEVWGSGAIAPVQMCAGSEWLPYPAEQTDPAREGCAFELPYDPATGAWGWDFVAEQQYDPQVTWQVDLLPHVTHVQAGQWDANGDGMGSDGQDVPWVRLATSADGMGPVYAAGYPEGSSVELVVDLPGSPDPAPVQAQAVPFPMQNTTLATFDGLGALPPGTVLQASGERPSDLAGTGPLVRRLVVQPVMIDVDVAADVVSGTAPPNADLEVQANEPGGGSQWHHVRADGAGSFAVDFSGEFDLSPAGGVSVHSYDTPDDHDLDVLLASRPNVIVAPTLQVAPDAMLSDGEQVYVWGEGFPPNSGVGIAEAYGAPDPANAIVIGHLQTDGDGRFEGSVTVHRYVNGVEMSGAPDARLVAFDEADPFRTNAAAPISFLPPLGPITVTVDPTGTVSTGGWATISGTITCGADVPATLTVEVWEPIGRKSVATGSATILVQPCWTGQAVRWTAVVKPSGVPLVPFGSGTAQVQVTATQQRFGDQAEATVTPAVKLTVPKSPKPPKPR